MATVPNVQLAVNANKIQVFWEVDLENFYPYWNLYWDIDSSMGSEALALGNIPNIADNYYSKHHIVVTIDRPDVELVPIYLRIKGIMAGGVEDGSNPSATRYVPATNEIDPMIKQKGFGFDPDMDIWRPIFVKKDPGSIAGLLGFTGVGP
jgi:hypothetical protein